MYKELRGYASTGEAWAEPFIRSEVDWLREVRTAALNVDPRWRAITRYVPRGGRVLDAGCGMGQWDVFLARKGYRVCGLDFSERMIAFLKKSHPDLEWVSGTVQSIPLPDASFDGLISWGVIEHDEAGPEQALSEFLRVLKPGGHAILTVPIDSRRQRVSSDCQFRAADARTFFQYFMTPEEFRRFLVDAGFRIVGPIVPVSRHHALAFPRLFRRLQDYPPVVRRVAGWALKPATFMDRRSINMIMAVGEKP
jgi:ubiquinone/menaquinone biosynthesis C-methylase UbiE